jgi:hypothetical protein
VDQLGPHLAIYEFDIETGAIGVQTLKETLIMNTGMEYTKKSREIIRENFYCFNKLYTKRYEFIYFFSVINDYDKYEQ